MNKLSIKCPLQVLQILLNDIHICIDIEYISKIMTLPFLETVPGAPNYLAGLMNFSGQSIPVIDLSLKLNLIRKSSYTLNTPVLLCSVGSAKTALIVDKIININIVNETNLQMKEEFDTEHSPFLAAITQESNLSLLLNMNQILLENISNPKIEILNMAKKND